MGKPRNDRGLFGAPIMYNGETYIEAIIYGNLAAFLVFLVFTMWGAAGEGECLKILGANARP